MAQEKKVPQKEMPKEVSIMGGCPLFGVSSHLLNLAELEAEGKAKKARLRAQQRGRVAKGKKGRFAPIVVRYLSRIWELEVCRPPLRPHSRSKVHRATQSGRPARQGESSDTVPQMSPAQKAR